MTKELLTTNNKSKCHIMKIVIAAAADRKWV